VGPIDADGRFRVSGINDPTTAEGREREFATLGCGRSVAICPSRRLPPANDRYRQTLICSMSSANVRFTVDQSVDQKLGTGSFGSISAGQIDDLGDGKQ
jgi:hypothetical protein